MPYANEVVLNIILIDSATGLRVNQCFSIDNDIVVFRLGNADAKPILMFTSDGQVLNDKGEKIAMMILGKDNLWSCRFSEDRTLHTVYSSSTEAQVAIFHKLVECGMINLFDCA